ncbi:MAG: hypothetical protein HY608_07575 [Planctomycetes bacterium]|nr:hypothetical protein [Planctomycetota bacterium]
MPDAPPPRETLLRGIVRLAAQGVLPQGSALQALRHLLEAPGETSPSLGAIALAMAGEDHPAVRALLKSVLTLRRDTARSVHASRSARLAIPPEHARDLEGLPFDAPLRWKGGEETDEETFLSGTEARFRALEPALRASLLDAVLLWPTARAAKTIGRLSTTFTPEERERAILILTLRFGGPAGAEWETWRAWLGSEDLRWEDERRRTHEAAERPAVPPDPALPAAHAAPPELPRAVPLPPPPSDIPGPTPWTRREREAPPEPEPLPRGIPLWRDHLQPLFVDNWYLAVGIAMVLAGSALLAYFTWDRHWLVRYGLLPAMLGGIAALLGRLGAWLQRRAETFEGAAAALRGAAVALLPIALAPLAFLADDPMVAHKTAVVPALSLAGLAPAAWGLRRWCGGVHASLAGPFALSLLAINALALARPVGQALLGLDRAHLPGMLALCAYAGFAAASFAAWRLAGRTLTPDLARRRPVGGFVGASLAITSLAVFAWSHAVPRVRPDPQTYACLAILAGGLVLWLEARLQGVLQLPARAGPEAFCAYALLLLGILMGIPSDTVRIAALALAGAVWLAQGVRREHALHDWIGLTLLSLAGVSVGLLEGFPRERIALLGPALALLLSAAARLSGGRLGPTFASSCRGLQGMVLVLSTAVAALAQWHFRSAPPFTAAVLLADAALLLWLAHREGTVNPALAAALACALALPYLGCADVLSRTWTGNTMAFGLGTLSFAWLALARLLPGGPVRTTRSTVVCLYGALAATAFLLRIGFEGDARAFPDWTGRLLDWCGPLLATAALVFATYHSRSHLPTAIGVLLSAVLFPQMKAGLQEAFPALGFGSGLGSAASAVLIAALLFRLRSLPALQNLSGGDPFLGGNPFPMRRTDPTLFTSPLICAALFLAAKVETWNLARNLPDPGMKTCVALCLSGAAWTLLALFRHPEERWKRAVHLGWIWLAAGIALAHRHLSDTPRWDLPTLATVLSLLAIVLACRACRACRGPLAWLRTALGDPYAAVLRTGSQILTLACIAELLVGHPPARIWATVGTAALLHAAYALGDRRSSLHGLHLFLLGWVSLLHGCVPGSGPLIGRLTLANLMEPTVWLLLGVQGAALAAEVAPRAAVRLRSLLVPARASAVAILIGLAAAAGADALLGREIAPLYRHLLAIVVLLVARRERLGPAALAALGLGYLLVHEAHLDALAGLDFRLQLLTEPWRLGALGAVAGGTAALFARLGGNRILSAPAGETLPGLGAESWRMRPWMLAPAIVLALLASGRHAIEWNFRNDPGQLGATYLSALALAAAACGGGGVRALALSGALVVLGNIHAVRVLAGPMLRGRGLSETHLVCLGLWTGLALAWALRRALRSRADVVNALERTALALAGTLLALLAANYLVRPDLQTITPLRFAVSGALALASALPFRRASRSDAPHAPLCEGVHLFGIAMAIWCAALLVEPLRSPARALWALSVPAFYFAIRAEIGSCTGHLSARAYRDGAAVVGFLLLGLYASRGALRMAFFPHEPIRTDHYHDNAPAVLLLGLLLLRLRGLGGTGWLSFYGGMALVAGTYFTVTALPGWSPFEDPTPGAWIAVALALGWSAAWTRASPIRKGLSALTQTTEQEWDRLRQAWELFASVGAHAACAWACSQAADTRQIAPLLAGAAATLLPGALRTRAGAGGLLAVALIEILAALHADFAVPSYLGRADIVWAILGLFASVVAAAHACAAVRGPGATDDKTPAGERLRWAVGLLSLLSFAHVLYHHPGSSTGLSAFCSLAMLLAASPSVGAQANALGLPAVPVLAAPVWIAYFSQAGSPEGPLRSGPLPWGRGPWHGLETWPLLILAASILATGALAARARLAGWILPGITRRAQVLLDDTLDAMRVRGESVHHATLWVATALAAAVQVHHYGAAFEHRALTLLALLWCALGLAWMRQGKLRDTWLPYTLAQGCLFALLAALRRQLMLTTSFWTHEYDVWASLAASLLLAGLKPQIDRQGVAARRPAGLALLVLPAVALAWTYLHGLGTDLALVVLGLHSMTFSFLGRSDRHSPYNIVALAGFTGFVTLAFWSKLELRVVQAYVIPVGVAILLLLRAFGDRMEPGARNRIRLATLLAMLGSSGYYALFDVRHPLPFHLTFLALGLLAIGMGGLLHVRLYAVLGTSGVLLDLASLVWRALAGLDAPARMTALGFLILATGAVLVGGAVYYKSHREEILRRLGMIRARFSAWE